MKIGTVGRITKDNVLKKSFRHKYWAAIKSAAIIRNLLKLSNRAFAYHAVQDLARFLANAVRPVSGQTKSRARAAVEWIIWAQDRDCDGGISFGYFPCNGANGWGPSYPETTGYIIPSLLEFARVYDDRSLRDRALRAAQWETEVQMESGAVQGGVVGSTLDPRPVAFNTGMVLDGWSAAYRTTGNKVFLDAGRRAGDFLVRDISEDGYFRSHGPLVSTQGTKTYTCLCAWPLFRHGQDIGEGLYQEAAIKVIEAALTQQEPNGWFANNCISRPEAPLLHTICYTLQGILEVGILAQRADFIQAVRRATDRLLSQISRSGFLHGAFYSDWEPAAFSSCLSGSAQLAVVCYRLYEHTAVRKYWLAAQRLTDYLKGLQVIDSGDRHMHGALGGSFPLLGSYMRAGYPSWASKYFLDSLMLQDRLGAKRDASNRSEQ